MAARSQGAPLDRLTWCLTWCQVIFRAPLRCAGLPLPSARRGGRGAVRAVHPHGIRDDRSDRGDWSGANRGALQKLVLVTAGARRGSLGREGDHRGGAAGPRFSADHHREAALLREPKILRRVVRERGHPHERSPLRGEDEPREAPKKDFGEVHPHPVAVLLTSAGGLGSDLGSDRHQAPSQGRDHRRQRRHFCHRRQDDAARVRSRSLQEELNPCGKLRQPFGDRRCKLRLRMATGQVLEHDHLVFEAVRDGR